MNKVQNQDPGDLPVKVLPIFVSLNWIYFSAKTLHGRQDQSSSLGFIDPTVNFNYQALLFKSSNAEKRMVQMVSRTIHL